MARARGGAAWVLLAAAWVLWAAAAAEARSPSGRRVHRHLKRLNKPAVKSIEVGGCSCSVVRGIRNDWYFLLSVLPSFVRMSLEETVPKCGIVQIQVPLHLDALVGRTCSPSWGY